MEEFNVEKTRTQMRKGILEMCILSIIDKNKEAYVSDLIEALKTADMIVVEGTFAYPIEKQRATYLSMERIYLRPSS